MYYVFLIVIAFYTIQYLESHTVGQMLWDGISFIFQIVFGFIFLWVFLLWVAQHS